MGIDHNFKKIAQVIFLNLNISGTSRGISMKLDSLVLGGVWINIVWVEAKRSYSF